MDASLSQSLLDGRWGQLCRRLEPLLGDIPGALGPQWHERLEALFSEADLAAADAILSGAKAAPDWFVIRYAPAGKRLDDDGDGFVCTPSWAEAVAVLLRGCEGCRYLPSRIAYDEARRILQVFAGDALLATVAPLSVHHVSPALRRRALSTVGGLRRTADARAELLKRVRKWPRMADLAAAESFDAGEMQRYREQMAHHAIPQEWLLSARLLCIACGQKEPATATVQAVAAIALGAPGWNHLAAPHGDRSAGLLQPWYLCQDDGACAFYADAIDGLADLLARTPHEWAANWRSIALDSQYSFTALDYVPTYTLSEQVEGSLARRDEAKQVSLYPVIRPEAPAPDLLERIPSASTCTADDLRALFGVGLPSDVKARMLDDRARHALIVQDGEWRFTRNGDPGAHSSSLWVHRVGPDGNSLWSAAVPIYKGLLQSHRSTGTYVLCADYNGAHPVAVINGLSPLAAAQVRANLPDTTEDHMEFIEENRRPADREAFRKLLEQTKLRRSPA